MTKEYKEALKEVNEILKMSDSEVIRKIPYRFKKFVVQNMDKNYEFNIEANKSLKDQNIKPKTKDIISLIYRDYLVDKEERINLIHKSLEIKEKSEKEKLEKYNPENLFEKPEKVQQEEQKIIVLEKESIITRIIKQLKSMMSKFLKLGEKK